MLEMLVRSKVEDYEQWRAVFDAESGAARQAGLELKTMWRDHDDPNQIFFVFSIADLDQAKAYVADPASADAGRRAGVIEGELFYVDRVVSGTQRGGDE
jgi:hypothetical protein